MSGKNHFNAEIFKEKLLVIQVIMKFIYIILSLLFCLSLQAQMRFKTEKIKKIAASLPSKVLKEEQNLVKWSGCPQKIIKETDQQNTLCHVGVHLFNDDVRQSMHEHAEFLERMILELLLYKKDNLVQTLMDEYKLKWIVNGRNAEKPYTSIIQFLSVYDTSNVAVQLDFVDNRYVASWKQGNNIYALSYPATRELIQGMNVMEADSMFMRRLKNVDNLESPKSPKLVAVKQLSPIRGRLYRKIGICHSEQPSYSTDTYYLKQEDTGNAVAVYETRFPALSLINMMAGIVPCHNRKLDASIHLYGGKVERLSLPFSVLYSHLFEGMQCYLKLDTSEPDKYFARFLFVNEQMQYVHVAEVEVSPSTIFKENAVWKAHIYMFIPEYDKTI